MPKLDIAQHKAVVSTAALYGRDKYVTLEIRESGMVDGGRVHLTLDVAEAVALVRALDGAIDQAVTHNYMGGQA